METSIEFETGAQSPLQFAVTETDCRNNPWPDGIRLTVVQDESDTFYGSNLNRDQALRLANWLHKLLSQGWET